VMGSALISLAWLANKLNAHGRHLKAGETVLTGSVHPPAFLPGTGVAKTDGCLIKVRPQVWPLAKDILGNAATIFSPTIIQIGIEANAEAGDADEDDVNTLAFLLLLIGECVSRGTRVEIYQSATGTAPVVGTLVAANLVATWDGSLQFGQIANQ